MQAHALTRTHYFCSLNVIISHPITPGMIPVISAYVLSVYNVNFAVSSAVDNGMRMHEKTFKYMFTVILFQMLLVP
jgi:hypothetical protein